MSCLRVQVLTSPDSAAGSRRWPSARRSCRDRRSGPCRSRWRRSAMPRQKCMFCSAIRIVAPVSRSWRSSSPIALHDDRRQSLARLVQQQQRPDCPSGCGRSRASAARRRTGGRRSRWRSGSSSGNIVVDALDRPVVLAVGPLLAARSADCPRPMCSGNTCRSSGTKPSPARAIRWGVRAGDVAAARRAPCPARRGEPGDRLHGRALAGAVAAEQRQVWPCRSSRSTPNRIWLLS